MRTRRLLLILWWSGGFCLAGSGRTIEAMATEPHFVTIALGTAGGLTEANLSSYLLAPVGSTDCVALDAGTLFTGLEAAHRKGNLAAFAVPPTSPLSEAGYVLTHHLKAYLLTHAHLDHVAGLVLNSPDDTAKPILGLPATIEPLQTHLFNDQIWPNFGDAGPGVPLKKYHMVRLRPREAYAIAGTQLTVTAFPLCHAGEPSTAFLLHAQGASAVYVGDTGPDAVEHCDALHDLWQVSAPLVRQGTLRGIFVEISYPDDREVSRLYGHLTPRWLMAELRRLAALVNADAPAAALRGLTVIVSHIKPSYQRAHRERALIRDQVEALNDVGVRFVFPEQGDRIAF
jgi:3',5'-cyclic-nucleotide phosphodiesterase